LLMCLDNKKLSILGHTWQQIHGCIPEPKKKQHISINWLILS
jgi:hypothetical protein